MLLKLWHWRINWYLFVGFKTMILHSVYSIRSVKYVFSGSSRSNVFCKKSVLRNFTKFTGKHLCQSLFFNKVAGLKSATLLKKRLWHRSFPENFLKFLRTPFLKEYLWWLLVSEANNANFFGRGESEFKHKYA